MYTRHFYVLLAMLLCVTLAPAQMTTVGSHRKLRTSSLSKAEKTILISALEAATGENKADLLSDFQVFPEPLARTGRPSVFAISTGVECGMHRDCAFLIFREDHAQYEPILNSVAGDYDILTSRHQGFRDISLTNYQGVTSVVSVWAYDGTRYRVRSCLEKTTDGKRLAIPVERCG